MPLYINQGYQFSKTDIDGAEGGVILGIAMPMHQLMRRKIDHRYPLLQKRFFDPQLYLSGLEAHSSKKHCVTLSSYPWFGVDGSDEYDSSQMTQKEWKDDAKESIAERWTGVVPDQPDIIDHAVQQAVRLGVHLDCEGIIIPSPLTQDPNTDYAAETLWLESGIKHGRALGDGRPVYATVAIQDLCLLFIDPSSSALLEIIADTIVSRGYDGAYLVVEQSSEAQDTKHCERTRTLESVLHLVHVLSEYAGLSVFVNFMGAFGLACVAAGAETWATGWYKSMYRLRLADKIGSPDKFAQSLPSYWSEALAADIHLKQDFDQLAFSGMLAPLETETFVSSELLRAARAGVPVSSVPDWAWTQSNVSAAKDHFRLAVADFDQRMQSLSPTDKRDSIQKWLEDASDAAARVSAALGPNMMTKLGHISGWASAFSSYRRNHDV